MSYLNFTPDLFLESQELNKFQKSLTTDGYKKHILENSLTYGLIKNPKLDPEFSNGRVVRESNQSKRVLIDSLKAIDIDGNFLLLNQQTNIDIPTNGAWYWLKATYIESTLEVGVVSISVDGTLTGIGTKFTESLRGLPNFPARIAFFNSTYNTEQYDIVKVIDDEHAVLMKVNTSETAISTFQVEENLRFSVVGTFSEDANPSENQKYPFRYDSCQLQLVQETITNTRPLFNIDKDFYLARIRVQGDTVIVQDKRTEIWQSVANDKVNLNDIINPLIGVESIKWQNVNSVSTTNQIQVAWGMRSQNWAIDSTNGILTLYGSALGGVFKNVDYFTDGDFDGWRVYGPNGTYCKILNSVKQQQAINLQLDSVDVDDFPINQQQLGWVLIVPDAEEVEFQIVGNDSQLIEGNVNQRMQNGDYSFVFPISDLYGRCDVLAYNYPNSYYTIYTRFKTNKQYSNWTLLPNDTVGYYTEQSFDGRGILKGANEIVRYPYEANENGYIKVQMSDNAYSRVLRLIYKGDLLGVKTITDLTDAQTMYLSVGIEKQHQFFTGQLTLGSNLYISLQNTNAVEGNEFIIHFNCQSLSLNDYKIHIVRNFEEGVTPEIIKTIDQADVYQMLNTDGGIVFRCKFSDNLRWNVTYQNYQVNRIGSISMGDGNISALFDNNGRGKIKGWYGCLLCDGQNGTQDLRDRFIVGAGNNYIVGAKGGADVVTLSANQIPSHNHNVKFTIPPHNHKLSDNRGGAVGVQAGGGDGNKYTNKDNLGSYDITHTQNNTAVNIDVNSTNAGGGASHENRPPYVALFYYKKLF